MRASLRLLRLVWLAPFAAACGNPNEAASNCLEQQCPVGTAPALESEIRQAIDLDVAFDPVTYSGELAYKSVGEGSCALDCLTIEPCDEGTFPVITETCFTCGLVNPETGSVEQGACQ
jgi:hypothetical protein